MPTKRIAFISFFLLFFYSLSAQQLNAELSKNRIIVGDTLTLLLSVEVAANNQVIFPVLVDTVASGVEIVRSPLLDSIKQNGRILYTQSLIISAYDSAMFRIGPLKAIVVNGINIDTIYSNILNFFADYQVLNQNLEAKLDTSINEQIVRNKANVEAPFTFKELWYRIKSFFKDYWFVVLAAIILLVFGLYYYYKIRNKAKVIMDAPEVRLKPEIEALQLLDSLADKKLWQQGKLKDYYSELSVILRHYVERQWHIIALEATTDLIRKQIKFRNLLEAEQEKELNEMLTLADYVKFAKYQTLPAENDKTLKRAYAFVEATKPKIVSQPENEIEK
jgi:hypothetical protein